MTPAQVLDRVGLDRLIEALSARGYRVLGPTVRDGAIVYGDLSATADLPVGWTDRQEAAKYRLVRRDDDALFGYVVGPQSPKTNLHPAEVVIWAGERTRRRASPWLPSRSRRRWPSSGCGPVNWRPSPSRIGCSWAAERDAVYGGRRSGAFLVAVNCTEPGGTCFCTSMGTGPGRHDGLRHRPDRGPGQEGPLLHGRRRLGAGGRGARRRRRCRGQEGAGDGGRRSGRRPPPGAWAAPWRPPAWPTCCARAWSIPSGRRWPSAA